MNIKLVVSAVILMTSVMAPMSRAFATQATEAAPQDMTCKEFVDMSQQYKTAIAFVIVNKNSDFKGDDYVPLHQVETEAAPQDMTCKEFVDMSQQYKTAIAFVIVNKNSDFKGDDYVPLHQVETEAVPKMVKMCHQHPNIKLGELAVNLKGSGLHY